MKTSHVWITGFALLLLLVAATVSADTEFAPIADDSRAKTALPPSGKALVFVFRQDGGGPRDVPLWLDNRPMGSVVPGSFYLWAVDSGEHILAANADRGVALQIRFQPGRNYFVELSIGSTGAANALRLVPYARGRVAVSHCRLLKDESVFATAALGRAGPVSEPRRAVGSSRALRMAVIVKTGSVSLTNRNQSIHTTSGASVPTEFDSKASGPFGLEGEWRLDDGYALGVEYLRYSNDLSASGTGSTGTMDVTGLMLNGKKYFAPGGIYHPYLGAGVGAARANFSGAALSGDTSNYALQAMGGLEMRWKQYGIYTELKEFSAKTKDDAGNTVDVSSRGVFVGISAMF
jgi:opacity protein-like surface antigen